MKGMDEGQCWSEDTHLPGQERTCGQKAPLIHSYVHGTGKQVPKSSERVSLEKCVLMDHPKE